MFYCDISSIKYRFGSIGRCSIRISPRGRTGVSRFGIFAGAADAVFMRCDGLHKKLYKTYSCTKRPPDKKTQTRYTTQKGCYCVSNTCITQSSAACLFLVPALSVQKRAKCTRQITIQRFGGYLCFFIRMPLRFAVVILLWCCYTLIIKYNEKCNSVRCGFWLY